jgi:hypothetical protein
MKPLRLKEFVIGKPPATDANPRARVLGVVEKPLLFPELVPALAPT